MVDFGELMYESRKKERCSEVDTLIEVGGGCCLLMPFVSGLCDGVRLRRRETGWTQYK